MSIHTTITLPSSTTAHNWKPPGPNPPRAILILQHGFGEYAERYVKSHSRLILRLTEWNIEVWALDLEGHGPSAGEKRRGVVDVRRAVRDHAWLVGFVSRTAEDNATAMTTATEPSSTSSNGNNKPPIFLFGHSLGGLITAASASALFSASASSSPKTLNNDHGNQLHINSVILSSPVFPLHSCHWLLILLASLILRVLMFLFPYTQVPFPDLPADTLCGDEEQARLTAGDPMIYHGQISWTVAATAVDVIRDIWRAIRRGVWCVKSDPTGQDGEEVGVLVVHGRGDRWADWRGSKAFVEGVQRSRLAIGSRGTGRQAEAEVGDGRSAVRLVVMERPYHELLNGAGTDGEEILKLLLQWIEERISARES